MAGVGVQMNQQELMQETSELGPSEYPLIGSMACMEYTEAREASQGLWVGVSSVAALQIQEA